MQHPGTVRLPPPFPEEALFSFLCNLRTNRAESSSFCLPNINLVHKQPLSVTMGAPWGRGCAGPWMPESGTDSRSEQIPGRQIPGDRRLESARCQGWAGGTKKGRAPPSCPRSIPSPHSCAQETPSPKGPLQCLSPASSKQPSGNAVYIHQPHCFHTTSPLRMGFAPIPHPGACDQGHSDAVIPESLGSLVPLPLKNICPSGLKDATPRAPAMPSEN